MPARIPPIQSKADLPPQHQAVADEVMQVFGAIRGPFSMLLHSPELAHRVLQLVTFYREKTVVEGKLRSLAILAAVREKEAAYVWAAQVAAAKRAGLRDAAIDLLRAKGDVAALEPEERDIVTFARQLMRTNKVDQSLFDRLNNKYGAKWMVELSAATNYFAFLSGVVNTFEVPAPADGDRF